METVHLDASLVKDLIELFSRIQKHKCDKDTEWSKDELQHFIDVLDKDNVVPSDIVSDHIPETGKNKVDISNHIPETGVNKLDADLFEQLIDIQMIQKSLIPAIPKELMENLPPELLASLEVETETSLIGLAKKECSQEKVNQKTIKDETEQATTSENNKCLEEILDLADELSETQAQTIFIQLQSMIQEAEENVKHQQLKNLREELVSIKADNKDTNQFKITEVHQFQEKPSINAPEMSKDNRALEEDIEANDEIENKNTAKNGNSENLKELENASSEVVEDLIEMQVTQQNLMPELPEELMQALPEELKAIFQQEMQNSLQMMAHL